LVKTIEQLINKKKTTSVQIQWKDDNLNDGNLEIRNEIVNPGGPCISEKLPKLRNCGVDKINSDNKIKMFVRPKKVPVMRSKDSLW
jgi:hypothetical protein